jgi:hypothetical protein
MRDPESPPEWRAAAACADALLHLDAARQYGLVTGGPGVDVDRCLDLLARAKARGIEPTEAEATAALQLLLEARW